jgi:hypothetical protein
MRDETRDFLQERDDRQGSAEEVVLDVHLSIICVFRLMRCHGRDCSRMP